MNIVYFKYYIRFLLARLHTKYILGKRKHSDIMKSLATLPDTVTGTYDDIMFRINSFSEEDRGITYRILSWIILAFRPLTIGELIYVLELINGDETIDSNNCLSKHDILSLCQGLVIVEQESGEIKLVREFLYFYL